MVACRRMKCVVLVQHVDAWESPDNSNNFGSAHLHKKRSQHTRTQHTKGNVSLTRNCTHQWPFRPITHCSRWCLWQTRRHSLPPNIRRIRLPSEPVFERYAHAVDMIQAPSRSSIVAVVVVCTVCARMTPIPFLTRREPWIITLLAQGPQFSR